MLLLDYFGFYHDDIKPQNIALTPADDGATDRKLLRFIDLGDANNSKEVFVYTYDYFANPHADLERQAR